MRTRTEIEQAIREISAHLKEPMSNAERAWLVADRQDLRAELAGMENENGPASPTP